MKRICYITTVPVTIKTFILETANYLHEVGEFDVTFICDMDEEFRRSLPEYFNYYPITMSRGIDMKGILATYKLYKYLKKERFDIVQYSTPNASFYASIASKLAGIENRIYCQWGILYVSFNGFKRKIFKLLEKITCNLSTSIQPDSRGNLVFSTQEKLYKIDKGTVIWNGSASGISLKKFDISKKQLWRKEIRDKLDIDQDTFVVGFAGRITKDKGINELLQSAKILLGRHNNINFVLIGDLEEVNGIDSKLLNWAFNNNNIIFTGKVNNIEKYFSAMDLFILPSYREGFGSVIIEAQAMSVPVIVSNIPGPTEALINEETGIIIEVKNSSAIISGIEKLIDDEIKLNDMSVKAYKFVVENFDNTILKEKILENRNSMLKGEKNGQK